MLIVSAVVDVQSPKHHAARGQARGGPDWGVVLLVVSEQEAGNTAYEASRFHVRFVHAFEEGVHDTKVEGLRIYPGWQCYFSPGHMRGRLMLTHRLHNECPHRMV